MPSFLNRSTVGMALALGLGASDPTCAQGVSYGRGDAYRHGGYGAAASYDGAYAYGGAAIRGDYVGAPFTRFQRPSELVPSAWGYGSYGIPTITGIRPASVGMPTVYVIDSPPRALAARQTRAGGPRVVSRGRNGRWSEAAPMTPTASGHAGGARVVTVSVPHRHIAYR